MKMDSSPKGKYVVAVSGGVDSVVLLDMMYNQSILCKVEPCKVVVAHFDHGIRDNSHEDAEFVRGLAEKYGLPFEIKREELGKNASEEKARDERYAFLRSVAKKYNAKLVTAHHADDVIESIAINLSRGTGWRGLAVLDSDVVRPLTNINKAEVIEYAKKNNLKWCEDSTNSTDAYLRNRIRQKITGLDEDVKRQLLCLWEAQKDVKSLIGKESAKLIGRGPSYGRYFFTHVDDRIGSELLRHIVKWHLTRPQRLKALHAIKTYSQGKTYLAGYGVKIDFTSRNFTVKLIK